MTALILSILVGLAAHYITYVVVDSDLPPASWLRTTDRLPYRFSDLVWCAWCVSFWAAGAAVLATDWATSVPLPGLVWLAAASVSGGASLVRDWVDSLASLARIANIEESRRTLRESGYDDNSG